MWLVLCATNDIAALWAARGLIARGLQPLEIVTAESLSYNQSFAHRLSSGRFSVEIALADGRILDGSKIRGTLNRLQSIPCAHLRTAEVADRQYAQQELFALYLSWLNALPGVMVNRPTPGGLSGDWRHPSEFVWLAKRAGLSTTPYQQSESRAALPPYTPDPLTRRSVIVVGGESCASNASEEVSAGCVRLAELAATSLLGIDFNVTPDGDWIFSQATPLPDLRLGGDMLLDALARTLHAGS